MAQILIDVSTIRALATPESYKKGRQYYLDGAVGEVARRGPETMP